MIGTRNVLELRRRLGFKLIFASSSEICGDDHRDIMTADIPLNAYGPGERYHNDRSVACLFGHRAAPSARGSTGIGSTAAVRRSGTGAPPDGLCAS